ncbi:MAG TPA: SRPBCC family protein [Blastocatellia bacterium]|nr:SRPBCC family protein [Blastocatellia bacterium]
MAFKIEEKFELQAPVERVWKYLIDPAQVAVCLPGAELLEKQDERTFLGAVKVKVGPVTMSYKGTVKFTDVDEQSHKVRLVGEGREAGGGGSAKMTMVSKVTPLSGGGSLVEVTTEMELVGKIIQFGRGMIEEVSRQLFRQFSACVKQHLEVAAEGVPADADSVAPTRAVRATPLAIRALWAVLGRFVMRLFGKQAKP